MGKSRGWAALMMAVVCGGCGGEEGRTAGGGGAGGVAGSTSAVAGGGSSAGAAGVDNPGGGGFGGGADAVPCIGALGAPQLLFTEQMAFGIHGLSVTADELELFYVQQATGSEQPERPAGYQEVAYRSRSSTSEPFGPAHLLVELTNVCAPDEDVNLDVSDDGFTLYISCSPVVPVGESPPARPLRAARREARAGRVALLPESFGDVFAAAAVSGDELRVYTHGARFGEPPLVLSRSRKTDSFAGGTTVLGLTTQVRSPDVSADELTLVGTLRDPLDDTRWVIGRMVRPLPDAAFSQPEVMVRGDAPDVALGAPSVTPDCSLYYVEQRPSTGYSAYVARMR